MKVCRAHTLIPIETGLSDPVPSESTAQTIHRIEQFFIQVLPQMSNPRMMDLTPEPFDNLDSIREFIQTLNVRNLIIEESVKKNHRYISVGLVNHSDFKFMFECMANPAAIYPNPQLIIHFESDRMKYTCVKKKTLYRSFTMDDLIMNIGGDRHGLLHNMMASACVGTIIKYTEIPTLDSLTMNIGPDVSDDLIDTIGRLTNKQIAYFIKEYQSQIQYGCVVKSFSKNATFVVLLPSFGLYAFYSQFNNDNQHIYQRFGKKIDNEQRLSLTLKTKSDTYDPLNFIKFVHSNTYEELNASMADPSLAGLRQMTGLNKLTEPEVLDYSIEGPNGQFYRKYFTHQSDVIFDAYLSSDTPLTIHKSIVNKPYMEEMVKHHTYISPYETDSDLSSRVVNNIRFKKSGIHWYRTEFDWSDSVELFDQSKYDRTYFTSELKRNQIKCTIVTFDKSDSKFYNAYSYVEMKEQNNHITIEVVNEEIKSGGPLVHRIRCVIRCMCGDQMLIVRSDRRIVDTTDATVIDSAIPATHLTSDSNPNLFVKSILDVEVRMSPNQTEFIGVTNHQIRRTSDLSFFSQNKSLCMFISALLRVSNCYHYFDVLELSIKMENLIEFDDVDHLILDNVAQMFHSHITVSEHDPFLWAGCIRYTWNIRQSVIPPALTYGQVCNGGEVRAESDPDADADADTDADTDPDPDPTNYVFDSKGHLERIDRIDSVGRLVVKAPTPEEIRAGRIGYKAAKTAQGQMCVVKLFIPEDAVVVRSLDTYGQSDSITTDKYAFNKYRSNKVVPLEINEVFYNSDKHYVGGDMVPTICQCCNTKVTDLSTDPCHHHICSDCYEGSGMKQSKKCATCEQPFDQMINLDLTRNLDINYETSFDIAYSCVHVNGFEYRVNEEITVLDFDPDPSVRCAPGIHYCLKPSDIFIYFEFMNIPAGTYVSDLPWAEEEQIAPAIAVDTNLDLQIDPDLQMLE